MYYSLKLGIMQKFKTSIVIKAPKEKVWETLFNKETYEEWTKAFNPTSSFKGDWSEGSKMLFVGTDEKGENEGGMVSRIAKNMPNEHLSIEHLGILVNGVEDTTSEKARSWAPAFENYTLKENDGVTEVIIEQDLNDEYLESFAEMWKKALLRLKELAEK